MGFKFVEPQGEPVAVIGIPAATVTESFLAMLSEAELTDEIGLDGNTVTVHGKPVGRLEERKVSKDSIDGDLYFVATDGTISQIKDNDIEDLVNVIQYKYLNK